MHKAFQKTAADLQTLEQKLTLSIKHVRDSRRE
jgi:hypothetical protein